MTPNTAREGALRDESDFRDAIKDLLRRAHEEGIDIEGNWSCEYTTDAPGWDVEIIELATRDNP